ncbi:MAG TPA: ABC transporter ATP-binding protein [Trebonia sp.]|nr:ABC transporter ATP-binding protein [Trebonia sp.]
MYQLTDVSKQFRQGSRVIEAVSHLNLRVEDGEWLAVRGRTGHGKSTLLNLLGGLDRPTSGQVQLDGRDLARLGDTALTRVRAATIGFVFQTFNLIPTLSAAENVEAALVPLGSGSVSVGASSASVGSASVGGDSVSLGRGGAARRRRVAAALESVGLADRMRHLPTQLSGGQQQRVAIARALVKDPKVLLADEPTGNLDTDTRDEIIALLEKLWRERGLTLILVSHDSSVTRRAQRVAVMDRGHVHFE